MQVMNSWTLSGIGSLIVLMGDELHRTSYHICVSQVQSTFEKAIQTCVVSASLTLPVVRLIPGDSRIKIISGVRTTGHYLRPANFRLWSGRQMDFTSIFRTTTPNHFSLPRRIDRLG